VLLRYYLCAMVGLFALCFVAQALFPRETAALSVWGFAIGWQREIGFFDLAFAVLAFSAVRSDNPRLQGSVTLAIVILTMLVGTNHLLTILSSRTSYLHEIFVGVNYAAVAFGFAAILSS
jgi:KinB signaling pathway activation protein